jgi:hypothetical protein
MKEKIAKKPESYSFGQDYCGAKRKYSGCFKRSGIVIVQRLPNRK